MVARLDRLAQSTRDLSNMPDTIAGKGAGFRSLGDVPGRDHHGRTATSLTRSAGVMAAPPAGSWDCTSGCSPKCGTVWKSWLPPDALDDAYFRLLSDQWVRAWLEPWRNHPATWESANLTMEEKG